MENESEWPRVTGLANPSRFQSAIFQEIVFGKGNAVVNAVAGSGKTTTIASACKLLREAGETDILFIAFNNHIIKELQQRVPKDVKVQTTSSLGYETLRKHFPGRKFKVEEFKYKEMWREGHRSPRFQHGNFHGYRLATETVNGILQMPGEELAEFTDRLFRLFQLAVATFTDPQDREALQDLADDYGMILDENALALYGDALGAMISVGEEWARDKGIISFGDMLYLPVKWKLRPRRYRVVMADEAQDLNEIQLRLIEWTCEGGRLIAVGDPWQSIYGWNGANPKAFERIRELAPNTVELPLSICYRCPKRVIRLAQDIVPHIEAGKNAPDGITKQVDSRKLFAEAKPGDLILCRVNGPLLSLCFSFLAARIPARVRGSDVGRTLIKTIKMIGAQPGFVYDQFPAFVAAWGERVKATLRPDDERAEKNLEDLQGSILACFTHYPAKTVEQLAEGIKSVFGDNMEKGVIWLSSVHKAKGLEAGTVWILHPEMLGRSRKRQTEAQRQEELRVKYVALTRAKERLFFVVESEEEGGPENPEPEKSLWTMR